MRPSMATAANIRRRREEPPYTMMRTEDTASIRPYLYAGFALRCGLIMYGDYQGKYVFLTRINKKY